MTSEELRQKEKELYQLLNSLNVSVGGYAVLRDNKKAKYYFIEHPTNEHWLINSRFWYEYASIDFSKFEFLSYQ